MPISRFRMRCIPFINQGKAISYSYGTAGNISLTQ